MVTYRRTYSIGKVTARGATSIAFLILFMYGASLPTNDSCSFDVSFFLRSCVIVKVSWASPLRSLWNSTHFWNCAEDIPISARYLYTFWWHGDSCKILMCVSHLNGWGNGNPLSEPLKIMSAYTTWLMNNLHMFFCSTNIWVSINCCHDVHLLVLLTIWPYNVWTYSE